MNKFSKTAIALATVIGITACGDTDNDSNAQSDTKRTVQVVELSNPNAQSIKHFNGVVSSQDVAGLSFRVPGTIETLLVDEGDLVEKGQLIATLDKHDYQVALEELQAKLLEAQSAHKLAANELKRVKQARKDDAIASVNLDRAMSGFERSAAVVKVVEKNIQRAEDALRYTELRAPFDGIVGGLVFEEFEQVAPGLAIVDLQAPNSLQVEIDVPENLIANMSVGQTASVSWYGSDAQLDAEVSEISPFPHIIKQTYTVKLTLPEASDELFIGKSLVVSANVSGKAPAYCIPYSALMGEGQYMQVNVIQNNQVTRTAVEVKSLDAQNACVDGELAQGDQVVVNGTKYLLDGETIGKVVVRSE